MSEAGIVDKAMELHYMARKDLRKRLEGKTYEEQRAEIDRWRAEATTPLELKARFHYTMTAACLWFPSEEVSS